MHEHFLITAFFCSDFINSDISRGQENVSISCINEVGMPLYF